MPIAKLKQKSRGTGRRGEVTISGFFVLAAAGAIASQTAELATVGAKTANGRYPVTFDKKYIGTPRCSGITLGTTGGANIGAGATANAVYMRDPTTTGCSIQLHLANADTDGATGLLVHYEFVVEEI